MEGLLSLLHSLRPWEFWNAFVLIAGGCISLWFYFVKDKEYYKRTKAHSRQLLNTLPNIWTSLGIFGTFCAICISLDAFSAINGKDEVGMSLILKLIGELIPAFSTSIWGIILAVTTTIINKQLYNKDELDEFEQLDSPENNIKRLVILVEEQKEQSRIYNDQLTSNILAQSEILKKFVDDFVARMDVIFKKMETSIEQQVHAFGQSQFEQSRQVLEKITQKMSDISSGLLEQQRDNMKASFDATQQQLSEVASSLSKMATEVSTSSSNAIQELTNQQNERLAQLVETSSRGNEEMLTKMQQLQTEYATTCTDMLARATEQNEKVANQLNESLTDVVTQISQTVKSECDGLAESINKVVLSLKDSYEFIDDHIAQIKSDYEQATLAYRDALQNAHDNNESLENTIMRVNESLAAMQATNKNIKTVLSILENRQTNIDMLTQRIKEMGDAIVTLQNLEAALNKLNA